MKHFAGELIPRQTVEDLVKHRDRALVLHGAAYDKMVAAAVAVREAWGEARRAAPSAGTNRYNLHNEEAKAHQRHSLLGKDLDDKPKYMAGIKRLVDTDVWASIIKLTDLERLMDKKAKDQFQQQLLDNPPEATVDNITATLHGFAGQAGTIFKRGIAECFTNLDRRFKSHDGWKIGARAILTYAFDAYGWNYHRSHDDTLRDIERVFLAIEGKTQPQSGGIVDHVHAGRRHGSGPRQSEFENDYFKIRGYKNGNCHIWFKRDDLVAKVNQLLGEYYGAPIPEDREADKHTGLHDPKTTLAKNYGFYPTPAAAAEFVLDGAPLHRDRGDAPLRLLEPSAGTGNLARELAKVRHGFHRVDYQTEPRRYGYRHIVDCIEYQIPLCEKLKREGCFGKIWNVDFLALKAATIGYQYDGVVMNPPFDQERDIDHVIHALDFLKPDGFLIAIMSAGTEFRETKKAIAFRELMSTMKADWRDLPARSFSEVGTNCNTIRLRVRKNGTPMRGW